MIYILQDDQDRVVGFVDTPSPENEFDKYLKEAKEYARSLGKEWTYDDVLFHLRKVGYVVSIGGDFKTRYLD